MKLSHSNQYEHSIFYSIQLIFITFILDFNTFKIALFNTQIVFMRCEANFVANDIFLLLLKIIFEEFLEFIFFLTSQS